jgi:predicted RNase H-like nuclease
VARGGRVGVGIDGWRRGWVVAALEAGEGAAPRVRVVRRIEEIEPWLEAEGLVPLRRLVDIPVGLPAAGTRAVEGAAKKRLAALGAPPSSVFPVPPRIVFDALDFAEAQRLAQAATGKGLSLQSWHLVPKIREVDLYLRRRDPLRPPLCESHPELVFALLAARLGAGPLPRKATPAGVEARLALLRALAVETGALLEAAVPVDGVAPKADDLLDATILAWLAARPERALAALPDTPETDPLGLPMEMVIPAPAPGE